jgi:hypothetical protein
VPSTTTAPTTPADLDRFRFASDARNAGRDKLKSTSAWPGFENGSPPSSMALAYRLWGGLVVSTIEQNLRSPLMVALLTFNASAIRSIVRSRLP